MSTRGAADIVFCLDASGSMAPCFDAVRRHIGDFIQGLESNRQTAWDWRIDFVAHCAGAAGGAYVCEQRSLFESDLCGALYGRRQQAGRFFTKDLEEFKRGLAAVEVNGDEAPLAALDFCLDFPWRDAAACHRVVILMTDEAVEDGVLVEEQRRLLAKLIDKLQRLRVLLFIVAPSSAIFDELSRADKSEYEVVDVSGDGLAQVDFRQVLSAVGKSVSVASRQAGKTDGVERGLFGQASWGVSEERAQGA